MFEIPVTLFIFKRTSTLTKIIGRINEISPRKVYLIADGGRTDEEHIDCIKCRKYAESLFSPEIELIKNYSDKNRGVYRNIGLGAMWVFEREEQAIFIEDDNLPAISFFPYCEELLQKYKDSESVLWICGTNYLGTYDSDFSYVFTKHMLPCGWASWASKYTRFYDGNLKSLKDSNKFSNFKNSYNGYGIRSKILYLSQKYSVERTKYLVDNHISRASWDYQMCFSVRANCMYGISPCKNQINNIGVDEFSIHGGNVNKGAIEDFCNVDEIPLAFPLKHPETIAIDRIYEKKITKILTRNWFGPILHTIAKPIKKLMGLNEYDSFKQWLKNR